MLRIGKGISVSIGQGGGALRSKLSKDVKEVREQEMSFPWEKGIPSRDQGRSHSETGDAYHILRTERRVGGESRK